MFIVAGEPSGDQLGSTLMHNLHTLRPDIVFEGIGGQAMQQNGLKSLFPMHELSVVGLTEVIPKYRSLRRRVHQTVAAVLAGQFDALVTIDSPDFCLRVTKLVKAASNIRTVHYVVPSVWAWRPKRAQKMAHCVDQVLALFPFEPPYMEAAGMRCDFVGHPLIARSKPTNADARKFRNQYGLEDTPILLVLPGSRRTEVQKLMKPFREAVDIFCRDKLPIQIVIPTVSTVSDLVREDISNWPGDPIVIETSGSAVADGADIVKRGGFAAANIALAASGTVSLELAAARTPMVIGYRFSWLTWQFIKHMAITDTATLVNLLSDTRDIPECLGPMCRGDMIAKKLNHVWLNPETQIHALETAMIRISVNGGDPGLQAAKAVLDGLSPS